MINNYYEDEYENGSFSGRNLRISPIEKENHQGPRIFERPHILAPSYKREQAKEKKDNHVVNNLEVYDFPGNNLRISPIESENHQGPRIFERPHILAPSYKREQANEKGKTLNFKKRTNIKY